MRPGSFKINGVHSDDLKSVIQYRPTIETPRRKVKLSSVGGRSGDIPFDENAYENTDMSLSMFTAGKSEDEVSNNREKIVEAFDSGNYVDFIPYFDDRKIYKVMLSEGPSFTSSGQNPEVSMYTLDLTIKPYKMLVDNDTFETASKFSLINKTRYASEPKVTIYGSGDITLRVNNIPFVVKGVEGHIIIDSQILHAYKDTNGIILQQDSKVFTMDYPILKPGLNIIEWTGGSVSKVIIEPRWRSLI